MTFKEWLTGVANTIRAKKGKTDSIKAADFIDEIDELVMPAQLFAPSIEINGDMITITDNENNGAFTEGYGVYVDDTYIKDVSDEVINVNNLDYDIIADSTVKVVSKNDKFADSEFSNIVEYSYIGIDYERASNTSYYCTGIGNETDVDVVIKSDINGIPVVRIYDNAFEYCDSLISIEIPDSVTSIGNFAFRNCENLTSVTIPNSVTYIGMIAFAYCSGLTSVVIGDGVKTIGSNAFYECNSLENVTIGKNVSSIGLFSFNSCNSLANITVSEENTVYKSIDGDLYSKDMKTLVQYAIGKPETVFAIPENVETIGTSAFKNCESLTSVTIPDSVTTISANAFYNCSSLTSIEIPDSVTTIGSSAFYECSNLTSVEIGDGVASIGERTFYGCKNLTSITIPYSVTTINSEALRNCIRLISITYGDTIEQWNAISKPNTSWYGNTGDFVIHCTDGDIAKADL